MAAWYIWYASLMHCKEAQFPRTPDRYGRFKVAATDHRPKSCSWEEVRYQLEKKLGLHAPMLHRKRNAKCSYLVGFRYDSALKHTRPTIGFDQGLYFLGEQDPRFLRSTDRLGPDSKILIARVPAHFAQQKPYVPPQTLKRLELAERSLYYAQHAFEDLEQEDNDVTYTEDMSEDQKMQAVLHQTSEAQHQAELRQRKRQRQDRQKFQKFAIPRGALYAHPSEFALQKPSAGVAKPPPTYVCHLCNQPGHFKEFCPTADRLDMATGSVNSFAGRKRHHRPALTTGIMFCNLRRATEEEQSTALLDPKTNTYWVRKRSVQ